MSLKDRAQQHGQQRAAGKTGGEQRGAPIELFRDGRYGIVDDQIVDVIGVTDLPGMSLAYICSDPDEGWTAPVPFDEIRVFKNINHRTLQQLMRVPAGSQR